MSQPNRGIFSHPVPLLAATFVLAGALWVLFVGSLQSHELLVGLAATLLTSFFCRLVFRHATLPFQPTLRDLAEIRRLPANILTDCTLLLRVLARDLAGHTPQAVFRTSPFAASRHDPERIARAVLAVTYMTATPNSIVIGIDPAQSLILYHQIQSTPRSVLVERLGRQA